MGWGQNFKNFLSLQFPTFKGGGMNAKALVTSGGGVDSPTHNLNNTIFPSAPNREPKDIGKWREAIRVAEDPFWPYRTPMQELFEDTILGEQVAACMFKRNNLTLLRKYGMVTKRKKDNEKQ